MLFTSNFVGCPWPVPLVRPRRPCLSHLHPPLHPSPPNTHTHSYRLQASEGFWKAGGFRGVYKGLGAAAAGSAPGAALFFSIYESLKQKAEPHVAKEYAPLVHMAAASIGETGACLIRVPTENVKQNLQAGRYQTQGEAVRTIMGKEGMIGFYKGFLSTVFREVSRGREGGSDSTWGYVCFSACFSLQ